MNSRQLQVLACIVLATACSPTPVDPGPSETTPGDGGPVAFDSREVSAETADCAGDGPHCATVTIDTIGTTGGGTALVRDNLDLYLEHDLISRLRGLVPEDAGNRLSSIDALVAEILAQHQAFVAEFPEATARWSVEISVRPLTNTASVVTLEISEIAYTGGAHPNSRTKLVSFDVASGQLLGIDDLTTEIEAVTDLVKDRLRVEHGLGPDDDLGAAGFWVGDDDLALPDNLGIVAEGLRFHWDAYEIAPYSMGPIDVTIAAAEIAGLTDRPYW
jgi:hypothetical protein